MRMQVARASAAGQWMRAFFERSVVVLSMMIFGAWVGWAEEKSKRAPKIGGEAVHWAYVPPSDLPLPDVSDSGWVRNGIDHLILARLEKEGLAPSPMASKEMLIRRVSLDLTGLPPTVKEIRTFLADESPGAYERLVDRLLASPHYGERWARPWLDQARYADTNGYEADNRRTVWPYRDWVINALNQDMPFDQFTVEQLAGDLLPNPTREQIIATGFHRNTLVNTEGGTDDEEFRVAAIVDRINTTFEVWMATTIGCAQCHNHKYDPFTQKEYYQLFAIFNQTKDRGKSNDPQLELLTPEQTTQRSAIRAKIEPLQKILDTQTPELDAAQAEWEQPLRVAYGIVKESWRPLDPVSVGCDDGIVLQELGDYSVLASGPTPTNAVYEVIISGPVRGQAIRLETLIDGSLPHNSSGRSEDGDYVLTELVVKTQSRAKGSNPGGVSIKLDQAYADHAMERYGAAQAIDGDPATGWSIAAHEPENRSNHEAVFVAVEPFTVGSEEDLVIRLEQRSVRQRHLIGRFRLSVSEAPEEAHDRWGPVPERVRGWLSKPSSQLTELERKELSAHYRSIAPELEEVRKEIAKLRKQEPKDIASTLVMEGIDEPRETRILVRGSHLNKGAVVEPGVPAILHDFPEGEEMNRLGFARWLVSSENPLVGRVTMNRIWALYFGTGLVETSEEFGSQGEQPSHPALLDWLALEFVRQGWSLKAMHRLIVTSAAYKQSASSGPALYELDPQNRLVARGSRFRMEAEMLRDNALAIAGLLDRRIGGRSVFPDQPPGIWNTPYNGDQWKTSPGGDRFRRGIYTFWKRSAPYPSFQAFDAPSREVSCERRVRSNTPVQALVTLNDPAFVVAAAGLARGLLAHEETDLDDRIIYAFERCVARKPSVEEKDHLVELYVESYARFRKDLSRAKAMAGAGGLAAPEDEMECAELAAWTVVANVLLNLDETLSKG